MLGLIGFGHPTVTLLCVCVRVCFGSSVVLTSQLPPMRGGVLSSFAECVVFLKGNQENKNIFDFLHNNGKFHTALTLMLLFKEKYV